MRTSAKATESIAKAVRFERRAGKLFLTVVLHDGRLHSVPVSFFPSLAHARPAQRDNWRRIGGGIGFHWPDLDLDLSVQGMLDGQRELISPRLPASPRRKAG